MKFLFKLIFIPIFSIVIIPLILLAITYKSVTIPVDDFDTTSDVTNLTGMVTEDFDAFLENPSHDAALDISFAQSDVNNLLLTQFRDSLNENYLDEAASEDDQNYVIKEPSFGYQGTWIRFEDDTIFIESGMHAFVSNFTYKTSLLITFKADIGTDEVVLKLDKLNIGNLPLAWVFGVADWVVEKATGNDIEAMINDQLNGLATFDPKTREIKIDINDLVEQQLSEDPETQVLVNSLLTFISENELFDVSFDEGELSAGLVLGKMWEENFDPYILPSNLQIQNEQDLQAILANRASTLILSTLSSSESLFLDVDEVTLNRIFDYFLKDMRLPSGAIQEKVILDNYMMKVLMPYVNIENDVFKVNIPLIIEKVGFEATHHFETIIRIDAETEVLNGDLLINLNSITAGNGAEPLTLAGEHLDSVLGLIGDAGGFIQDGSFVIQDFLTQLDSSAFSISDIAVVGSNLRLYIEVTDLAIPIDEIADVVEDVLEILDNPDYPEELQDGIDDVLTSLLDPMADPEDVEQAVLDLVDTISELDPEDAETLYQDMMTALEGMPDFDYENLFDLLP